MTEIKKACKILNEGGVICFATETVYALACDATNDQAVAKLYAIKKRDKKKPIAIFAQNIEQAQEFLHFDPAEKALAQNFMPGALTLILQKKCDAVKISPFLNEDDKNIGLRIPNHQFSLALLENFNKPIAATSANLSSLPPAVNFEEAQKKFANKANLIIDGGECAHKIASTVVKIDDDLQILREGALPAKKLKEFYERII